MPAAHSFDEPSGSPWRVRHALRSIRIDVRIVEQPCQELRAEHASLRKHLEIIHWEFEDDASFDRPAILRSAVAELAQELRAHMRREEEDLVPALLAMVNATTIVLTGEDSPRFWISLLAVYDIVFTMVGLLLFDTVLNAE